MATDTTTTTNSARPSIHFGREDTHARDQSAQSVTDIPLTKVATTESTKSRRSIFSAIADRFRSGSRSSFNLRSRSRSHSKDARRKSLDIDRVTSNDSDTRLSSTEIERRDRSSGGDYVDVIRAQALFMEKLRDKRARDNITHNIDGLPIPPLQERERRRSSIVRALDFDKPLLAR